VKDPDEFNPTPAARTFLPTNRAVILTRPRTWFTIAKIEAVILSEVKDPCISLLYLPLPVLAVTLSAPQEPTPAFILSRPWLRISAFSFCVRTVNSPYQLNRAITNTYPWRRDTPNPL
jgi:hypothetical protein